MPTTSQVIGEGYWPFEENKEGVRLHQSGVVVDRWPIDREQAMPEQERRGFLDNGQALRQNGIRMSGAGRVEVAGRGMQACELRIFLSLDRVRACIETYVHGFDCAFVLMWLISRQGLMLRNSGRSSM